MQNQVLIPSTQFALILDRLAHQLIEHHDFSETDLVGLQPRGSRLAERLTARLKELLPEADVRCGKLDATFFRDDFRTHTKPLSPNVNDMEFDVEGRHVVLVDDVLFTGRTVRAALDALTDYGRPARIELAVLVDRGHREIPVQPDYVAVALETARMDHVVVRLKNTDGEDAVELVRNQ